MVAQPLVTLSALEHHVYCPRQAALIHVDGVWADNRHTVRGTVGHRRTDYGPDRPERGRQVLRGLEVWQSELGLTGRCDVVEVDGAGNVVPVEYKMGVRHGRAADVQLCAQALCLEEMFDVAVPIGYVWYGAPRRRDEVLIDHTLRTLTIDTIHQLRADLMDRRLPAAPADERCDQCQLLTHCLPGVVSEPRRLDRYMAQLFA